MTKIVQEGSLSAGKFVFICAVLGSLASVVMVEGMPADVFYPGNHAWEIKLLLISPLMCSLWAGVAIWKDADRGEMRQKTAGTVLGFIGADLVAIYTLLSHILFRH